MAKECSLGCDGAKIAVKMTQAYSFLRTAEMTQAGAIQIWQNEKSEWELPRSGSSSAYFNSVRFGFVALIFQAPYCHTINTLGRVTAMYTFQ